MNDIERPAIFFIADISGYTKFIFSNEKEISHSQTIIRELITTFLNNVDAPLELIRTEGDAIFLVATMDDAEQPWETVSENLVPNTIALFQVFADKLAELTIHKICNCSACINIEQLKLKAVVHSGTAAFYMIDTIRELTGTGPIIVHRLLKNTVEADEYILFTEAAYNDLTLPDGRVEQGVETFKDVGEIKTYVYYPAEPESYVPVPGARPPAIFIDTLRAEVSKEYAQVAQDPTSGFHFHTGRRLTEMLGYRDEWLKDIPEVAIAAFAGTGNPLNLGKIRAGQRILDIGCGAGLDCLIAGNMVGRKGSVVGIDMTEEMIDRANSNARETGANNVSFKIGLIEELPIEVGRRSHLQRGRQPGPRQRPCVSGAKSSHQTGRLGPICRHPGLKAHPGGCEN